jgi:hypothetical protein
VKLTPELFDPKLEWVTQKVDEGPLSFERRWRMIGDTRLRLNAHHHTGAEDAPLFWHPHLTPVFIWVLSGDYELNVGMYMQDASGLAKVRVNAPFYYELTHPLSTHAIRVQTPGYSVMLNAPDVSTAGPCGPLTPQENEQVLDSIVRLFKEQK